MNMRSYDINKLSSILKLLSIPSRLQLFQLLQKGELCVCELIKQTKLSQSLISHHLKDLKDFDLVSGRKEGKWSHYSLTPKGVEIINLVQNLKI